MTNSVLPDDIIERIMTQRTVFVATQHKPDYEFSSWACKGVFNTRCAAENALIKLALKFADDNVYDPAKRYFNTDWYGTISPTVPRWDDRWTSTLGIPIYRIEEWKLDDTNKVSTQYFNADTFIKRHITQHCATSKDAYDLLESWIDNPPYDLFRQCFGPRDTMFRSMDKREEWQAKYGVEKPYPYGD
jgi:hypothetical protein